MSGPEQTSELLEQALDPSLRYGLVGALRFPADEIQFGRVLHSLCRADEHVANRFCRAVLEQASNTGPRAHSARAQKLLTALGDSPVRSMSEQDLFIGSRGVLARKARQQGRIDLSFEAEEGWRLGVELKFNDSAKRGQQERYPAVGRPVVFVVRDPARLSAPELDPTDARRYLGAISWEGLLPALHSLPVPESEQELWTALLRVCELNGDFALQAPRNLGTERDAKVLGEIAPDLQVGLTDALEKKHRSAGRRFGQSLTIDGPYPTKTWGNIGLLTPREDIVVLINLRHTGSSQPAWQVIWPKWWYPIVHHKEYARLARGGTFTLNRNWWTAAGTVAPARWRSDPGAAATESIVEALGALVRSGVMGRLVAKGR